MDGELDVDLGTIVEVADHQVGIENFDIAGGLDVTGSDGTRALLGKREALGAFIGHLDRDFLDVEHEIGHVLAHARNRGEFVQDAIDLDSGDGRALQGRQQDTAQRVAQGQAIAAFKRLGDHGSHARRIAARNTSSFVGLINSCQFFWIITLTSFQKCGPAPAANAAIREPNPDHGWPGARSLDATPLARTATIMGNGCNVPDARDGKACSLQSTKRRLTPRTGTADFDLESLHAMFLGLLGSIFRCHLSRIRGRLARALETHRVRRTTKRWCCPARR